MRTLLPTMALLSLLACRNDKDEPVDSFVPPGDSPGEGYVDEDGDGFFDFQDCDDTNAAIYPGAEELCDGVDNDCNDLVDDGASITTWYADADGDGWGDDADSVEACEAPEGYVERGGDCDDSSTNYFPGAREDDCSDPNDYNCDGSTGYADEDGDGYPACEECDDGDRDVHPGANEVCDEVDTDCDGEVDEGVTTTFWQDADNDGYGDASVEEEACSEPTGFASNDQDCDDGAVGVNPGATELCNGLDDDCDGDADEDDAADAATWYRDADSDGYGTPDYSDVSCEAPRGYVDNDDDCDDLEPLAWSGASESCDEVDNDCDGDTDEGVTTAYYRDADGDSYGDPSVSQSACSAPSGYVSNADDCDDLEPLAYSGASEACDDVDNDCDSGVDEGFTTTWYLDGDGDGYGADSSSIEACTAPSASYVGVGGDCDDGDNDYNPGATPGCDGEDYDCDGSVDNDADGDGYAADTCGGDDCDDSDASILPEQGGGCALGTDCLDILDSGLASGDGLYTIDPDGSGNTYVPFDAYCDMTTGGGGWTRVSIIPLSSSSCVFTAAAYGDPSSGTTCAKYSDAMINDIAREQIFYATVGSYNPTFTHYTGSISYYAAPTRVIQGDSLTAVQNQTPGYTPGYGGWYYFHQQNWYQGDTCLGSSAGNARLSLEYIPNSGNLYACTGSCGGCGSQIRGVTSSVYIR
ncbi:MAG: hypothetical protein H6741_22875 [Alphaproteobacteria bacterium]|nr:hypothetical protein [Alphaproteobacteria bacterium]